MIKSALILLSIIMINTLYCQTFTIKQVRALNLEEDKGPFATFNDEVMIIAGVYTHTSDSILSWEHSKIYTLTDSANEAQINLTLSPNKNDLVLLALIELDTDRQAVEISKIMKEEFTKYKDYPLNLIKEKLNLILGDDDLLLIYFFKEEQLSSLPAPFIGKGMQLFNRFEYEFSILKQ